MDRIDRKQVEEALGGSVATEATGLVCSVERWSIRKRYLMIDYDLCGPPYTSGPQMVMYSRPLLTYLRDMFPRTSLLDV